MHLNTRIQFYIVIPLGKNNNNNKKVVHKGFKMSQDACVSGALEVGFEGRIYAVEQGVGTAGATPIHDFI